MLYHPDLETSSLMAQDRRSDLKSDWEWINPAQPRVVPSSRRHWRLRLRWLRTQLRIASDPT
jgi:hypothetical protein